MSVLVTVTAAVVFPFPKVVSEKPKKLNCWPVSPVAANRVAAFVSGPVAFKSPLALAVKPLKEPVSRVVPAAIGGVVPAIPPVIDIVFAAVSKLRQPKPEPPVPEQVPLTTNTPLLAGAPVMFTAPIGIFVPVAFPPDVRRKLPPDPASPVPKSIDAAKAPGAANTNTKVANSSN